MKIKSKDIARALGLSPATVSLARNGKPGVNEETRQRVNRYLETHGSGVQQDIAFVKWIIYINIRENFKGEVRSYFKTGYEKAIQQFQRARMEVKLVYAYSMLELEQVIEKSNKDGTAGIILRCDEFQRETYRILDQCKVPVVLEDSDMSGERVDVLNFNNRRAVTEGMDYLKNRGLSQIIYLKNEYSLYNFEVRRQAFRNYLEGNQKMHGSILEVGSRLEDMDSKILECLEKEKPDALFLENFLVSMGTVRALEQMGVRVPEDISLLGIDGLPDTVVTPYQLTHFKVPHGERSYYTAQLLLERMKDNHGSPGREVLFYEELVEGNSVREKLDIGT